MNQVIVKTPNLMTRILTIVGFIILILLAVWLAVKVVQFTPNAFSTLANLAESTESGREAQSNLTTTTDKDAVNSSESFTIDWSDLNRKGSYFISFECVDGATVNVRINNTISEVACGSSFELPADTFSIDTAVTTTGDRFTDIPYTISFVKEKETEIAFSATGRVTVINVTNEEPVVEEPETEVDTSNTEDKTENTSTNTTRTPAPVQYRYVTTYTAPVSDPNGYTDLEVVFVSFGVITADEKFVAKSTLETGERAAVQFKVTNIGTKTSSDWTFKANLPSGDKLDSKVQNPLKPKEYSLLTVAFDTGSKNGTRNFSVTTSGGNDTVSTNNTASASVKVND